MKRSSGPRKTANLSESVHQRLSMYAISATTAGVSLLALAQPSEAKIVYTPANAPISTLLNLDLNNDGLPDFELCALSSSFQCSTSRRVGETGTIKHPSPFFGWLVVFPAKAKSQQNRIWGNSTWAGHAAAAALPAGFHIGPKRRFLPGTFNAGGQVAGRLMATWGSAAGQTYYGGPWKNVLNRYLGLKFIIKGKIHYGWARLTVHWHAPHLSATLTGYAYETIPNYPIITGKTRGTDDVEKYDPGSGASLTSPIPETPQPASLGMLALGAQGVPLWRRKERQELIGQ
jgi:hypothetical protein